MKTITLCLLLVSTMATAQAQTAVPGKTYGAVVTETGAADITAIAQQVQTTQPVPVKLKARVTEVCAKKGCWMRLQVNDNATALVRMKDYGFFVSQDIKGKEVVIDGEAYRKITPVEELRHYAADAGKTPAEIAAITQPAKELRITANGIVVVK